MTAGQICTRGVDTARLDDTVQIAACRMRDRNVGCLVVVNELDKPVGIVTDRDIAIRVVAEGLDQHRTSIEDVMSERVRIINEELPVDRAIELMRAGPYRRLPVVSNDGCLIGLLSIDDVLDELANEFHMVGSLLRSEIPLTVARIPAVL